MPPPMNVVVEGIKGLSVADKCAFAQDLFLELVIHTKCLEAIRIVGVSHEMIDTSTSRASSLPVFPTIIVDVIESENIYVGFLTSRPAALKSSIFSVVGENFNFGTNATTLSLFVSFLRVLLRPSIVQFLLVDSALLIG